MRSISKLSVSNPKRVTGFKVQTGVRGGRIIETRSQAEVLFNAPALDTTDPASCNAPHPSRYGQSFNVCNAWGRWLPAEEAGQVTVEKPPRFWELDAARGLAILMMIAKHLGEGWCRVLVPSLASSFLGVWNLLKIGSILGLGGFFCYASLQNSVWVNRAAGWLSADHAAAWRQALSLTGALAVGGGMSWLGSGAVAFLYIMGISLAIRSQRAADKPVLQRALWRRGLTLLGLGLLIAGASLLMVPQAPVVFGVLHLLGASTILTMPFLSAPGWVCTVVGLAQIAAGLLVLPHFPVQTNAWMWLGLAPAALRSVDYTPLLPYLGLVLLGLSVGKGLYKAGDQRRYEIPDLSQYTVIRAFARIGRHALPVYLAQEPFYLSGMSVAIQHGLI